MTEEHKKEILVKVAFPVSPKDEFKAEETKHATVGQVLTASMSHFEVHDDSQFSFVLSFKGERQDKSTTISSLAGDSQEIRFTLIKVITSG